MVLGLLLLLFLKYFNKSIFFSHSCARHYYICFWDIVETKIAPAILDDFGHRI